MSAFEKIGVVYRDSTVPIGVVWGSEEQGWTYLCHADPHYDAPSLRDRDEAVCELLTDAYQAQKTKIYDLYDELNEVERKLAREREIESEVASKLREMRRKRAETG